MGHKVVWPVSAAAGVVWTPTHYKLRLSILVIAAQQSRASVQFYCQALRKCGAERERESPRLLGDVPALKGALLFIFRLLLHSLILLKNYRLSKLAKSS